MIPKRGVASAAWRAQRFWDAGVSDWDGDEFKKSQQSMNGLFGQLKSRNSLNIAEADSCEDAVYSNMVEEEMAMCDLGFDCGWGCDDDFIPADYISPVKAKKSELTKELLSKSPAIERQSSSKSMDTGSTRSSEDIAPVQKKKAGRRIMPLFRSKSKLSKSTSKLAEVDPVC
jgi:hypothetical protein